MVGRPAPTAAQSGYRTDSGKISAFDPRLPQQLDGRPALAQVRWDGTPNVARAVATTAEAPRQINWSAALVFPSPSPPRAVALARRAPSRCTGAREGPPPGPLSPAARPRGNRRRSVDGRVAKGLCSRFIIVDDVRESTSADRSTAGKIGPAVALLTRLSGSTSRPDRGERKRRSGRSPPG